MSRHGVLWRALGTFAIAAVLGCRSATDNQSSGTNVLWFDRGILVPSPLSTDGARTYVLSLERTAAAVDNATGSVAWIVSSATGDTSHNPLNTLAIGRLGCTAGAGAVICDDDGLIALRASDGAFLWRTSSLLDVCPSSCPPLTVRDSVAFWTTFGDSLISVKVRSGARRWAVGHFSSIVSFSVDSAVIAVGYVDFSTFPSHAAVAAVNDGTGAVLWRTKLGNAARVGGTALWQNFVLASASDGNVYALDRASGSVLWSLSAVDTTSRSQPQVFPCASGSLDQPLLVVKNTLFVETITGPMLMIDLQSHAVLHRTAASLGTHVGYPLLADSSAVYVIHQGGVVGEYSTADAHLVRGLGIVRDQICGVTPTSDRLIVSGFLGLYAIPK